MTIEELNHRFALPDVLHFADYQGLTRAEITTPAASATIYLHGAHISHWQPAGADPVLFLSRRSEFAPGKPIRGGVPVIFPWFGPDAAKRDGGKPGPMHGFARTQAWTVNAAEQVGDELRLTLSLAPTDFSRRFGFHSFLLTLNVTVGRELTVQLTVSNSSSAPLTFEEALHTYLAVADVRRTSIAGLEDVRFLDKTDDMREKSESATLRLSGRTDRVYLDTPASCNVIDEAGKRRILVAKHRSLTTVVWNPWDEIARTLPDLDSEAWPRFLCVETANAGPSAITLAPGAEHSMSATLALASL